MAVSTSRTRALRRLLLAWWVGGLATTDLVEAPARFQMTELDRNQIVAVGRKVFSAINRMEVGLGLVLLPLTWRREARGLRSTVLTMWGVALAQYLLIQPRMRRVGDELDFAERDRADPRYRQHRRLHRLYVALDTLKLILGARAVMRGDD